MQILNSNMSYQQVQSNDLIGFQTPLQSNLRNLFLTFSKSSKKHPFWILDTLHNGHT